MILKSAKMTDEERAILSHGNDAVRMAKEMVENCPIGYLIVDDHGAHRVYYKYSVSQIINTPYTSDHVRIAHRSFNSQHTHYIRWEQLSSEVAKAQRDYYVPKEGLANGLSAVKAVLAREFNVSDFIESHDIDFGATILRFDAEGRHFTVRVSDNFRDDYASKRQNVSMLAPFLREYSTGRVIVTNKAIEESQ